MGPVVLCVMALIACAAAAAAPPCQWSTPSSGVWSSGPWVPSDCQNNIASNITTPSGATPYEIYVDVPATISGLSLGRDVSLILVQDLNLRGGDLLFDRNGTILFAPTVASTPVRCSRVVDASTISVRGTWSISCGEIIGPADKLTQTTITNFANVFQLDSNSTFLMTRVNLTGVDTRRFSNASMGAFSNLTAVDSLIGIRRFNFVGPTSQLTLLGSSMTIDDAGLSAGVLALTASNLFLNPGSGAEATSFYVGAGSKISTATGTILRVGREMYLEDSSVQINILRLSSGSTMATVRSNVTLLEVNINGDFQAESSQLSFSGDINLRTNSTLALQRSSIVIDNSPNVTTEPFSIFAVGNSSSGVLNGGRLLMQASSLVVEKSSSLVLAGGDVRVRGCGDMNLNLQESTLFQRPCTILLSDNATLQTVEGLVRLGENGAIAMLGSRLLAGANFLASLDTFVIMFNKSVIVSTGDFRLIRGSETFVTQGSAIRVDGGIFRGIEANMTIDRSEFRVTGGSMELSGEMVVLSRSSNIFIGSTSLLDGQNKECNIPLCHIGLANGSSLVSSFNLSIVNNFRVFAVDSSVSVPSGSLYMANGGVIGLNNGTLIVSGPNAALFSRSYIVAGKGSRIQIDGNLIASGRSSSESVDSGLIVESGSLLSVGGTISLTSKAGISLSASVMVANLGTISTDATSAIRLSDGSTLYGTGRLDANVIFVNSTIGDVAGVTDLFIKNLTLSQTSNTTVQVSNAASSLRINSTTAILAGSLTVTIQPGAAVDTLKSGQELVLISSSDSLTGAFDTISLTPPVGESASCYNVQQTTKTLSIVFVASNSGCTPTTSPSASSGAVVDVDPRTAAIIGGSVAGGVVGLALIIAAIAFAFPSVRQKFFPFQARHAQRANGDTLED